MPLGTASKADKTMARKALGAVVLRGFVQAPGTRGHRAWERPWRPIIPM